MRKSRSLSWLSLLLLFYSAMNAQQTFPVNGVADPREIYFAFTNATIVKDGQSTLKNATLIIRKGKIVSVGTNVSVPKEAVVVNCSGKFIYPSLIDIYSDYGIAIPQRQQGGGGGFFGPQQFISNTKGAYGWNQAIKSDLEAYKLFVDNATASEEMRRGPR